MRAASTELTEASASEPRRAITVLYIALLSVICGLASLFPSQNWDVLAYTACSHVQRTTDFVALHKYAYDEVKAHFTAGRYEILVAGNPQSIKSYNDPVFFTEKLPFYSIRPMYVMLLTTLGELGISPVPAARIVSVSALFIIGLFTYLWALRYVPDWQAILVSILLVSSYPVLLLGRLHSPDGISTAVLLVGLFALFESSQMFAGVLLLALSLFLRTDNLITVVLTFGWLWLARDKDSRLLSTIQLLVLLVLSVGSVEVINYFAGNYGYSALFHNQFIDATADPTNPVHITVREYFHACLAGLSDLVRSRGMAILSIGIIALVVQHSPLRALAGLLLLASALHFTVFPEFEERFFGVTYIVSVLAAIASLGDMTTRLKRILPMAKYPLKFPTTRPLFQLLLFVAVLSCAEANAAGYRIITYGENKPEWNKKLARTGMRMGCSSVPSSCDRFVREAAARQGVKDISVAFGPYDATPDVMESYAAEFSGLSKSNPFITEISIDDFIAVYKRVYFQHVDRDFGKVIRLAKSINPNLRFGITLYEDELNSPPLQELRSEARNGVDTVYFYLHYRKNVNSLEDFLNRAKALFPRAQMIAGSYAFDRIDYIPCSQLSPRHCTQDEELESYHQAIQKQVQLVRKGAIAGIEFYPAAFGDEEHWVGWDWTSPKTCSPKRKQECIQNTKRMRQMVLDELKKLN